MMPTSAHTGPVESDRRAGLRPAGTVMKLERLGSLHASRLSFVRSLVRQMAREQWRVRCVRWSIDEQGFGVALYALETPHQTYHGVIFAHDLPPEQRSDRVIAEAWDVTFALVEGAVSESLLADMAANVPLQEAGRQNPRVLVLSRANKSLRNFSAFRDRLAAGRQPDPDWLTRVGYLYRTTAVYGNGKFGIADFARLQQNPDFSRPFSAQMFAVYLLRHFSIEQVEHLARCQNPEQAVNLHPALQRYLGIGNSTGLGMAPFLINHPQLIQQWVYARESALAEARRQPATSARCQQLLALLHRAEQHLRETRTEDPAQTERNRSTVESLHSALVWLAGQAPTEQLWEELLAWADKACSLEAQELLNTLLIELCPQSIDAKEEELGCEEGMELAPGMKACDLLTLVETHYGWALGFDPEDADQRYWFWYRSTEKEEPRLGVRGHEPGAEREMALAVGPMIAGMAVRLRRFIAEHPQGRVVDFLLRYPSDKYWVRRAQSMAGTPYGEIQTNLWHRAMKPMYLLRTKLSFFGASRFDPKSDRWVRVTLFQGAPLLHEFETDSGPGSPTDPDRIARLDDWSFPTEPNLGPPAPSDGDA